MGSHLLVAARDEQARWGIAPIRFDFVLMILDLLSFDDQLDRCAAASRLIEIDHKNMQNARFSAQPPQYYPLCPGSRIANSVQPFPTLAI
jgi:hypothetical protein